MSKTGHRYDKAAIYLEKFARQRAGQSLDPEELVALLVEVDRLAALDLKDCRTEVQKQKVYAVIAGATKHVIQNHGASATASSELYEALVNLVLGVPKDKRLNKQSVPSQLSHKQDNIRAALIVACENNPAEREDIIKAAAVQLNLSVVKTKKFLENYHGGRIKSQALRRNVDYFRKVGEAGESWPFEGLTS